MSRERLIFLLSALSVAASALSQTGIRATILHFEQQTPRLQTCWLLGLDRDVSERTSIGLDVIGHLNWTGSSIGVDFRYAGDTGSYFLVRKSVGLQYRSTFFLADRNSGAYIGTQVGFRTITRELEPVVFTSNGDIPSWALPRTIKDMVFPIGLRLGLRSEMDGWYGDVYAVVGTQLGKGSAPALAPYLDAKDQLAGFTFQVGYAVGVGW